MTRVLGLGLVGDPDDASPVHIIATDKRDPNHPKAKVWFDGIVDLDAEFAIDAMKAGEKKLKAATYVSIFDRDDHLLQTVEFHTSCSQPLSEGDQFGSLVLVGFVESAAKPVADPEHFSLLPNRPNPFNPVTEIVYGLPGPSYVRLTIYNLLGQQIVRLVDTEQAAGYHSVRWDASEMSGGIYLYRLEVAGQFEETKRMLLLK